MTQISTDFRKPPWKRDGYAEQIWIKTSDDIRAYYQKLLKLLQEVISDVGKFAFASNGLDASIEEEWRATIDDANDFVAGVSLLLAEDSKPLGVNVVLLAVAKLVFSGYYRRRGYAFEIAYSLSPDLPELVMAPASMASLLTWGLAPFLGILPRVRGHELEELLTIQMMTEQTPEGVRIRMGSSDSGGSLLTDGILDLFNSRKKIAGLGYPLAARMVEELGGAAKVLTTDGRNAGFEIVLPSRSA